MSDYIQLGTQLLAPSGYLSLMAGKVYHFLFRAGSVRLALFEERSREAKDEPGRKDKLPAEVYLIDLDGDLFDHALDHGLIVCKPFQDELPPWCQVPEVRHQENRIQRRVNDEKHRDRLEKKLSSYRYLLDNWAAIIRYQDPLKYLNQFARTSQPQINQKRLRQEFFAYLLYGFNPKILSYQYQRIGRWERLGHPGKKPGVKSLGVGAHHGFKSSEEQVIHDVAEAWRRWGQQGTSLGSIYRKLCAQIWQTAYIKDGRGIKRPIRTDGGPFLTRSAFVYRLKQMVGAKAIREKLKGSDFEREEMAPSCGKFTESLSNVGERSEADGYWVEELIYGPDGASPLPALVVVRIVDTVSGMFLGIGFSLGGETSAAYRMALFCSAIKKSVFGRLVGIEIDDESWPSVGLCDDAVVDKGAGGGNKGRANLPVGDPVFLTLPPTGKGQGKATVEASHPRQNETRDRPAHTETSLNLLGVVRSEIQDTISANDSRDMSGRLTPQMLPTLDRPTPLGIFDYCARRGRNNLRQISKDEAVRAFLTPVTLVARADGVYYQYQRYVSDALLQTGILQTVVASGFQQKLQGYMLDMCTRYCFLEWHGELIELSAVLALREDEEQLYISLHQLELAHQMIRRMKSDFRVHSEVVKVEGLQEFTRKTGTPPEVTTVRAGPVKRKTKRGEAQARVVKAILTHKGDAAW